MSQTVAVDPRKVVVVTDDYSGYLGGKCIACNASGWLVPSRYGYPRRMKDSIMSNRLIHTNECPMSEVLNDDGSIKK